MIKKILFPLAAILISQGFSSIAQALYPDYRFTVIENNQPLLFPFTGGLNSPVFAEIDLDGNNVNDLLIYEKTTGRILTFRNNGTANQVDYHFAPEYTSLLPALDQWVRTYDYDCDGDLDLFTYNLSYTFNINGDDATRVYRNDYNSGTGLQFTLITNELLTHYGSVQQVLPTAPVNLPAFTDVDGDGDMDILSFSLSSNFLEYHKNYSMDSTGTCNNLMFHVDPTCWGQFKLSGTANLGILNSNCQHIPDNTNFHAGSVLTAMDQGCDGDKDLINGDILGTNLLYLENGGTAGNDLITSQDSAFPSYDIPVSYFNLPGAYYIDVNNDSKKDLIVAGFATIGEDFENVLYYQNTTDNCSNVFQFQQNRFLVANMIDIGTASVPVFFDADNDGLMDLIIGNEYYYSTITSQKVSHLAWYKNTGTSLLPEFTLMNRDFANISSLGILGAYPAFGDLDNDGDKDMIIGNDNGELIYFQNAGGSPANFIFTTPNYQNIDVGANSVPQIIDVDRDGLLDLVIGERTGVLNYYRNTGTITTPVFSTLTTNFGGVNVLQQPAIQGNSVPVLYDNNGSYELIVSAENGYIYHFTNIDGNLSGNFTLTDSMWQGIHEPTRMAISRFDIDNDTIADIVAGNLAGGIRFYTHFNSIGISDHENNTGVFKLYPVPASDILNISTENKLIDKTCFIEIMDATGRVLFTSVYELKNQITLPLSFLPEGIYFLNIKSESASGTFKFIKQ